jgi:hypothetical protein
MNISDERWSQLQETRAMKPTDIAEAFADRERRSFLADDGATFIIAVDHPARRANGVGSDPLAMGNRRDLLQRVVTALSDPGVDGVMGTPDILDDLVVLGALEGKVAIGSMNRGGLQGTAWELDDQLTGHDVTAIVEQGLDGGKMLLRIDPNDPNSKPTIEACAGFISGLANAGLMAMVEPLPYTRRGGRAIFDDSADELIRCVGVASALGSTSAYTWLKLPASADIERVMAATSLPGLILGGAPGPNPATAFDDWRRAMAVSNVRGLMVGRSLLYPPDDDVANAVATAAQIVHPS